MRVLLADEHPKVRQALRMFIAEEPGLTIVGEASGTQPLLSQARALQPDVILLEWDLNDRPGTELLSALRALPLSSQVIVLSSRPECENEALAAGANGFVSKANGPEHLLAILREAMRR